MPSPMHTSAASLSSWWISRAAQMERPSAGDQDDLRKGLKRFDPSLEGLQMVGSIKAGAGPQPQELPGINENLNKLRLDKAI